MKAILRFSRKRWSIASWFIRVFTMSNYSHVDVVMPHTEGQRLFGALLWKGVSYHRSTYDHEKDYYIEFENEIQYTRFFKFLEDQKGKDYDIISIFGFFFHKRQWHDKNKWFCSELIAAASEYAGVRLLNFHTNRVTPIDLIKSLKVWEVK